MATSANPYAQFLGSRDMFEVLGETPKRLQALVAKLGLNRMSQSYAPGKWTLNAVVCHLADCEMTFGYRWRQIVAQPHHLIQPFDQDAWAQNYGGLDANLALASFCSNRVWNMIWLKSVPASALEKPVLHPERGELTLHKLLQVAAGHDLNHLSQFERVAKAVEAGRSL